MNKSLLPWTRLVLVVSALVQGIFALIGLLTPDVMHRLLWPPPFQPVPVLWIRYDAVLYLAMSLGAAYALLQNSWVAARAYLAIASLYGHRLFSPFPLYGFAMMQRSTWHSVQEDLSPCARIIGLRRAPTWQLPGHMSPLISS